MQPTPDLFSGYTIAFGLEWIIIACAIAVLVLLFAILLLVALFRQRAELQSINENLTHLNNTLTRISYASAPAHPARDIPEKNSCPNCGAAAAPGTSFCQNCGAPLSS